MYTEYVLNTTYLHDTNTILRKKELFLPEELKFCVSLNEIFRVKSCSYFLQLVR